jgi:putative aminopeptidase FrvX
MSFERLRELVLLQGPSGREGPVDAYLRAALPGLRGDATGNLVLRIAGSGERPAVAVAAHKDEIATVVRRVEADGRCRVRGLGDTHPWVWGETPLELLGDVETVPGVLSFGARHVSEESAQRKQVDGKEPLRWEDAWVETRRSAGELAAAGVRAGTVAILPAHRREPTRLGSEGAWIAAPNLDDRVGVLVLLLLAERLADPPGDVELVFSTREEVGCQGVRRYLRGAADVEALVAVEVHPVAPEYGVEAGPDPVVLAGDAVTLFDERTTRELTAAGERAGVAVRHALPSRYGCDASRAYHEGLVDRAGAVAMTTDNTHGLEIVHLDAPERAARLLQAWLETA